VPRQGEGIIEITTELGEVEEYSMDKRGFVVVPPPVIHKVRKNSSEGPFVFLMARTPRTKHDFIAQ
jgi:oxalate decarboxylase/phosphoglucose isomerase-like protein (cupin superfamily)